jgi:hypothetical protein
MEDAEFEEIANRQTSEAMRATFDNLADTREILNGVLQKIDSLNGKLNRVSMVINIEKESDA